MKGVTLTHGKGICHKNMLKEYSKNISKKYSNNMPKRGKTTHTPPIAKLTPMPKYTKIQKKSPYYKDY